MCVDVRPARVDVLPVPDSVSDRCRWPMFDVVRFVAAAGVVWVHATLSSADAAGRFAVPFFVMAAVFFAHEHLARNEGQSFVHYAVARFRRICPAFAAWGLIYLALRLLKRALLGTPNVPVFQASYLYVGTAGHLWFLPFILAVGLGLFPLLRAVARHPCTEWPVVVLAAAVGLIACMVPPPSFLAVQGGSTWAQTCYLLDMTWCHAPSVLWGVAFAVLVRRLTPRMVRWPSMGAIGCAVAFIATIYLCTEGRSRFVEAVAGVGSMVVAIGAIGGSRVTWCAKFGRIAFGIYLVHVVFVEMLRSAASGVTAAPRWSLNVSIFLVSLALSTGSAMVLARRRWSRWLVC